MAEYVEIKHVENELHIVIKNTETRREEVEQENMRLREEIRNLKSQVRQLRQSSEGDDDTERTHRPLNAPRRDAMRPVPRL
jgi:predicted RNase H-like nuclease (RuvC/YqgF family)